MMTQDTAAASSPHNSTVNSDSSNARQRKKRKWDQPAESVLLSPVPSAFHLNPAVAVPKLNQVKMQDELIIAREIVINDADPSVRCKLTKRQTQEEIQKFTGAVVITRGKYRPPNSPPDTEKPLYLHISAGAHLKDTTERILAVDRAAAMVDEILKPNQRLLPASSIFLQMASGNDVKALSTSLFLGFDPDPSLNIPARIRGPNDQYINHIMNETGATVVLRGRGSLSESVNGEEALQQLHLVLSASSSKSLEDAKRLAENLLDTIRLECGIPRVSPSNAYNAVPPPLSLAGVQGLGSEKNVNINQATSLTLSTMNSMTTSTGAVPDVTTVFPQRVVSQSGTAVNCVQPHTSFVGYPQPLVTGGTSYSGYGGIYPQATPLQQVALVLRQSPSPISSITGPTTSVAASVPKTNATTGALDKEKRPTQRRKFQEVPIGSKDPAKAHQGSEFLTPGEQLHMNLRVRNTSNMPAPRKVVQSASSEIRPLPPKSMPRPPPRSMPPPHPPPKFNSTPPANLLEKKDILIKSRPDSVPDTLVKLMEYGDEDDDLEDSTELNGVSSTAPRKPFWAL